ncbi:MAG: hypothetical protein H6733_14350 [Alphaproteobacteria bacterium]|nr:hypothetical protein [Alphaproteobacteria bacterium]
MRHLLLAFVVAACTPSASPSDDTDVGTDTDARAVDPAVVVRFPPAPDVVTDQDALTVRGVATPDTVVRIGDHGALAGPDGAWQIVVPLEVGTHDLEVDAVAPSGALTAAVATLSVTRWETLPVDVVDVARDPVRGDVYLADRARGALLRVDRATGTTARVGTSQGAVASLSWDAVGDRLLAVLTAPARLVAYDPDTDTVTTIADAAVGTGPDLDGVAFVVPDPARHRLIAGGPTASDLLIVDPTTGDRVSLVDLARVPRLHGLASASDLVVDAARDRLLAVVDDAVLAVDPTTGAVTTVWSGGHAAVDPMAHGAGWLDADGDVLFTVRHGEAGVSAVDLVTGTRRVVSSGDVGTGPALAAPVGLVADGPDTLLVASAGHRGLVRVDRRSGARTLQTAPRAGAGDPLGEAVALTSELSTGRLWVLGEGGGSVVEVDVAAGTLHAVTRPVPHDPWVALAYDPFRDQLLLAPRTDGIEAVDLATGTPRVLAYARPTSTAGLPTGVGSLSLDPSGARLLMAGMEELYTMNLGTGEFQVASGSRGRGPGTVLRGVAVLDDRVLVLDPGIGQLLEVDLPTGDRSVLSSFTVGEGPTLVGAQGIFPASAGWGVWATTGDQRVIRVDLYRGDRIPIVANDPVALGGRGTPLGVAELVDDPDVILFLDSAQAGIWAHDRVTGEQVMVAK